MADSTESIAAPAAEPVVAAPVAAPGEAAPVAVVEAPVVAEASVAPAAEPVEAKAAEVVEALKPHTDTPSLLQEHGKEAAKPGDKPAEAKPAEAKPAEVVPEAPAYEFKIPEGFTPDPEGLKSFTELMGSNKIPAEAAQTLLDRHITAVQQLNATTLQRQHEAFAETRKGWATQAMADEQIGGSGFRTSMGAIARMRDLFVPEGQRPAFDDFLAATGAGDHPAFLKMLHNAARFFDEPGLPPAGAKPTASNGRAPGKRSLRDIYRETAEGKSS